MIESGHRSTVKIKTADQLSQQPVQLLFVAITEAGQQLGHRLACGQTGPSQHAAALGGQPNRMAASIVLIATTLGQPLGFQLVQHVHQRGLVHPRPVDQPTLVQWAVVGQLGEHREMAQIDAEWFQALVRRRPGRAVCEIELATEPQLDGRLWIRCHRIRVLPDYRLSEYR